VFKVSDKLGQLDLVFVVDNTGSMGPYIDVTKRKILEIIRTIKKEELCHRLRVGLVSYRDHPPEEDTFVTRKYELTPDTAKIEQNIREMSASGGGDGPEAVSDALNVANRMEFLLDAAKIVVLVADAPPHGVEPGDRWPDGPPSGVKWEQEVQRAFEKGTVVHAVGCYPEIASYQNAIKTFEKIASGTRGKFFPLEEAETLVSIITGVAIEEIDKIAIQQSILEELGASIDEIPEDGAMSEERVAMLTEKMRAGGFKKRALRAEAAPAGATQVFEVEDEEVTEDDVKEALRQLSKKR
jgi:Mg-chelatase subunit ChlD